METTIFGLYGDNGKEHGNYYIGLYSDNEKQHGNYCSILGLYWDNGKTTETTILGCIGTL